MTPNFLRALEFATCALLLLWLAWVFLIRWQASQYRITDEHAWALDLVRVDVLWINAIVSGLRHAPAQTDFATLCAIAHLLNMELRKQEEAYARKMYEALRNVWSNQFRPR